LYMDDISDRSRINRDILSLVDFVDRQDGPAHIRGSGPGLQAAYDRMVSASEDALVAQSRGYPTNVLRSARTALRRAVNAYRASLSMGRVDHGYESD